jgi:hypothetical protein
MFHIIKWILERIFTCQPIDSDECIKEYTYVADTGFFDLCWVSMYACREVTCHLHVLEVVDFNMCGWFDPYHYYV